MPASIAVVSSDCHLQNYTWAKHPELHGDSYFSFKQIIDYAIEHRLPLILAGDVINVKRPDPRTVGFLMDQIERMNKVGLPIYFIQGQHEMNRDRPWMCAHSLPVHIHKQTVELWGRRLYGLDYVPADQLPQELDAIPVGTDCFIGHQVWKEALGYGLPAEGSFTEIPYAGTVVTGDFHAHRVTHFKGKQEQALTVVSPGSTYMLSLDEDPRKFFFVLHDDLSVLSIPIRTRPYYKARIGSVESLETFIADQPWVLTLYGDIQTLPEFVRSPIWHIEYYDNVPDVAKRLEQVAAGKAHLFLRPVRIKDEVPMIEGEEVKPIEVQPTLEGYLPHCLEKDDPRYNTVLRLLRSNDPKAELQQLVTETIAVETQMEEAGSWSNNTVQEG